MKVLILTTEKSPYRVELFDLVGKQCELYVAFEEKQDRSRNASWYVNRKVNYSTIELKGWEKSLKHIKTDSVRQIKKIHPELVIMYEYSTYTSMYAMLYCIRHNIPYIVNCDGGFISNSRIKNAVKRFFISRAYKCLAGGEYAKKYQIFYGADEKSIIKINFSSIHDKDILQEPISGKEKKQIRESLNIDSEHMVLSIGQFIYRKGFDVLIDAAGKMNEKVSVVIIGGQPTSEYVERIRQYGINNVLFYPFMGSQELVQYFKAADIFVLPTREDIWGLVINEAMAFGLPIITTDKCIAGLELIKNDENGYIVAVGDSDELVSRVNQLLEDDYKRENMCLHNLKAISDYTIEGMAERIITGIF